MLEHDNNIFVSKRLSANWTSLGGELIQAPFAC